MDWFVWNPHSQPVILYEILTVVSVNYADEWDQLNMRIVSKLVSAHIYL